MRGGRWEDLVQIIISLHPSRHFQGRFFSSALFHDDTGHYRFFLWVSERKCNSSVHPRFVTPNFLKTSVFPFGRGGELKKKIAGDRYGRPFSFLFFLYLVTNLKWRNFPCNVQKEKKRSFSSFFPSFIFQSRKLSPPGGKIEKRKEKGKKRTRERF